MKNRFSAPRLSVTRDEHSRLSSATLCFFPITTELLQLKRTALLAYDQHLFFKDSLCQSIEITALLLIWFTLGYTRRVRTCAHLSVRKQTGRPPCLLHICLHYLHVRGAAIQSQASCCSTRVETCAPVLTNVLLPILHLALTLLAVYIRRRYVVAELITLHRQKLLCLCTVRPLYLFR